MNDQGKIKVVFLIHKLSAGGAEKVVMDLAEFMNKQKFEVEIWCSGYTTEQNIKMSKSGVTLKRIMLNRFWLIYPMFVLITMLRKEKPLILHSHLFHCDIKGRLCGRLAKVPIIISTYHTFYAYKRFRTLKNSIKVFLDNITATLLCDKIITVSKIIARSHITLGTPHKKIKIIPNPVDINQFKYKDRNYNSKNCPNKDTWKVVTICRLVSVKGLDFLLNAIPNVLIHFPKSMFFVVGDGPIEGQLKQHMKESNLNKNVDFVGYRKDIKNILQSSDIFVLPSLSEGVPISVLEAMSIGLPVVATKVGGIPDIIVNHITGMLVPPKNSQAISDAILSIMNNPNNARLMGWRARQWVEKNCSIESVIKQTENLYIQLMESKLTNCKLGV